MELTKTTRQGANIASAATISPDGDFDRFDVTGAVGISAIETNGRELGARIYLRFTGAVTLTHDASDLILASGTNVTTAANDLLLFEVIGENQVRQMVPRGAQALGSSAGLDVGTTTGTVAAGDDARIKAHNIVFGFLGKPPVSAVIAHYKAEVAYTLPISLTDSQGAVVTNPSSNQTLDIQKNGASIGTVNISTGGAVTFTFASAVSFAIGDILKVVAPAIQNSTMADGTVTLAGTLG